MKIKIWAIIMFAVCATAIAGQVGLPTERIALPAVQGSHLVCIWDQTAGHWYTAFAAYDNKGEITFQVPAWGKWYWIGLWDETNQKYVFGKWIGHFITD
jgi:hypothetical protein